MTPTVFYTGDENFKSSRGSQQHVQIETGEELLHGGPEGIAIIGFSLEFPQDATSSEGFWKMMAEKRCAMTEFPPDRLNIDAFYHPDPNRGDSFSFRGGHFITKDLAAFDANFFTISPSEAAGLDPAHRRLLETSYKAFENAGISMESLSGSNTSVHTACFTDDYKQQLMKDIPQLPKYASTGTAMAMLANRLSWFYNLTGQSSNVDTACSSSVLAIDQACQLLRNNDCDMSIVAGCNINYTPEFPNLLSKMSFLSPDSRCYSFDDRANGYARGEGIAVIVLKRISDAIHDNDTIRAVIRSSGSNQDGFTPGITQPSSQLQERLIRHTYQKAGLSMKHTRFFEAHGTGTAIGDPIEASAIGNAFRQYRTSQQPLFVGSVKSNIGHLEAASGLSGLIKSILMLETGIILPNANFKQLNPRIDSEYLRISIPTKTIQWPAEGVRRVSLNSFGFGGSNCHLVVDDALHYLKLRGLRGNHRTAAWPSSNHLPLKSLEHLTKHEMSNPPVFEKPAPILASSPKLMIWSASDKAGVLRLVKSYEQVPQQLHDTSHNTLEDIAYTLGSRRSTLPWKSYAIVTSLSDFEGLERTASTPVRSKNTPPRLGFLFSGQGGQWYDMGRGLLAYSTFKATVQELDFYLAELGCPWSLESEFKRSKEDSHVNDPEYSQIMTTALQIALVDFLKALQVTPAAIAGHSSGEIAAAYCSGALSKRSAIKVAYFRGLVSASLLRTSTIRGGMLSVGLSAQDVQPYLDSFPESQFPLQITCFNSPKNITISGEEKTLDLLQTALEKQAVFARRLQVPLAYHSSQMQAVAEEYWRTLGDLSRSEDTTSITMVSSVTGDVISQSQLCNPEYWVQNLVSPVRFSDAIKTLCSGSHEALTKKLDGSHRYVAVVDHLVEIGPHTVLQGPLRETLTSLSRGAQLGYSYTHRRPNDVSRTILELGGQLHSLGISLDLRMLNEPQGPTSSNRVTLSNLPEYPFDPSQRYWHESRLSKDYRLRKFGYNEFLGTPSNDWNPLDARWRHFIRPDEMPWVGDHKINGMTVYPGAGVLVMAIEASKQLADSTKLVSGFEFRNVKFQQALSITSEGTEICFSMRKQHTGVPQYDVYSFSVYAIIYDKWIQTSVGEVHIRYEPPKHTDLAVSKRNELAHYQEMGRLRSNSINNEVDPTFMYEYLRNHGLGYGPQFQAMRRVFWGPDKLASTNVHLFESPLRSVSDEVYTVHPVTLDAVLHTIFPAMSLGGTTNMLTHIPIAIKNIWISARDLRYPENMDIEVFTDVHMETPHTTTSSLFALNKDRSKLIITGDGLRTSSVGDTQPNESLNTSEDLDWMWVDYVPDVDLLPASDTERYLSQRSSLLSKAKEYLSCLAKKTDSTRILCMGSSSSDLTKKLLDPFFTNPGTGRNVPRFQSITLTASSQSDLEILQKVFQDYPGDIKFQVLSGRHNMKEQGLEESYDLILATVINQDMTYLLKNGGKILTYLEPKTTDLESINGCNETGRNFSVATSSGELKHLDTILHLETHEAEQTSEITVLSSASSRGKTLPLLIVVDKGSSSQINMATILSQQFLQLGYSDIDTTTLADSVHHHQISTAIVIMLLDYDRPVLEDLNQDDYLALRNLIPMCRNILWTSGGGGLVPVSPGFGLINGLSRAVRVEFENLKLVTLALEPCQEVENHASMITRLVCGVFPGLDHGFYEREYIEIEGILHFKRMISDFNLRAAVSAHSRSIEEKVRSLAESPRFSLALPTHGTSDPLKFVHYQEQPAPLETNAIDVDIRAIGIGAIDALVESGNINRDGLGIEGSGVVSNLRYGSKSGLKKGDRVCFIGHNLLGSNACLQRQFVAKIPASMPLSDAATLPSDYTVAFYIVHDIIRPTKEDSILIFDPESSFSRALVRILATTGVSVMTATESSGRVFSELKFSERLDIQSITTSIHQARGKGLKAIVGPMGEILSSVDLVGSFGHIIAVKLPGDSEESDLSLTGIPSSVTFRVLDWMSVIEHSLSSTKYSLQDIFDSCDPQLEVQRGFMGHFPVAQIHDALKSLKGESASKKAIVELNPKDFLKITRENIPKYSFDSNSSYLIAGGLGGLGRSLSRWMVSRGAKNLILLSTRGPRTDAARELLSELTAQEVKVYTPACDVTDLGAVKAMIEECRSRLPPIKGCVQASMVTFDVIYEKMTWDDWRKVTNPKVQGSWNLHLALPKGLDFFIMTASISSVMGLISQVNYGAANSYLDALACFRIGEGQKAVSLNLGLLGEEGFLKEATPHKLDRLLRTGYYTPLSRNDTLAIFDYYCNPDLGLLPPSECQPVIGIRTPTEIVARNRELPPAMRQPLWNLFPLTTSISIEKSITDLRVDLSQMIKNADSPAEVANIVGEALMKQVSNILATPLEGIEFHNAVSSYGIDSLTAVELRNWVSKTFQVEVAVFDIMGGASFATIGNIIAKNV